MSSSGTMTVSEAIDDGTIYNDIPVLITPEILVVFTFLATVIITSIFMDQR